MYTSLAIEGRPRSKCSTLNILLFAIIVVLLQPYWSSLFQSPPSICLVNLANNPRTASVFSRGMLEKHGSKHTFDVVSPTQGCHPASTRIQLVNNRQLVEWCLGDEVCIVTGDEECHSPAKGLGSLHDFLLHSPLFSVLPDKAALGYNRAKLTAPEEDEDNDFDEVFDEEAARFRVEDRGDGDTGITQRQHQHLENGLQQLRPNTILREFYSSKYDYPSIALGARYEFLPVPESDRDAGNRKYLFNFMGSIKVGVELDREHLREVIRNHNWTMPTHFRMFSELVRNPNSSTVNEYRETLLASSFTLAPVGTADDCFRFWEAIEAGSVPIYVRRKSNLHKQVRCPDAFEDVLATNPPIVLLNDWDELPDFANRVTEAEIDDMRKKLVLWSWDWWSKQANAVDDAIDNALKARNDANLLPEKELKLRVSEVSAALSALKEQQAKASAATKAIRAKENAIKAAKANARRAKKRKKQQEAAKHKKEHANQRHEDQLQQRLQNAAAQMLDAVSGQGPHNVGAGEVVEDTLLQTTTFNFVHDVIHSVLAKTGYLADYFSQDESNRNSAYMQYPVNRISYLHKVIKAVAKDLGISADYISATEILDAAQPQQTRLFMCFLAAAASRSDPSSP